jgi:hypothetical protein
LASSPSDFKASSPTNIRHLRQQAPQDYAQEKLPKLKSATSTSYYDLDTNNAIPFYGTQEPEEYLEWEHLMDDYLKLHQVPLEDQVKCATRNFHDYASTWWLHTPSESYDMSWPKTKRALRREFVPPTYTEQLQRQLENTIQGSKSLDKYFHEMKKALRRAGVDDAQPVGAVHAAGDFARRKQPANVAVAAKHAGACGARFVLARGQQLLHFCGWVDVQPTHAVVDGGRDAAHNPRAGSRQVSGEH